MQKIGICDRMVQRSDMDSPNVLYQTLLDAKAAEAKARIIEAQAKHAEQAAQAAEERARMALIQAHQAENLAQVADARVQAAEARLHAAQEIHHILAETATLKASVLEEVQQAQASLERARVQLS